MPLKVFITGIRGYLGSNIARVLSAKGHVVAGSSRRPGPAGGAPVGIREIGLIRLGQAFEKSLFDGIDIVIHCAHDFSRNSAQLNVSGTKAVYDAAVETGVPRHIFISSYSARPDAISGYGKVKHELETFFLAAGQTAVRPGLVIGNGGLFGRTMRRILRSPLIPLVDQGRDVLPVIGIEDFAAAMTVIVESARPGVYNLFNSKLITLRALVEELNQQGAHRARFSNVPTDWAVRLLTWIKRLGIPFPVGVDNLRALKVNQQCTYRSDLAALLPFESPLESALRSAVASWRRASSSADTDLTPKEQLR